VFTERTSVGLDVHARSVVAAAIDSETGKTTTARLVPSHEVVIAWVAQLPGRAAVTYEAGPTGFGLARAFAAAGVRCVVAAPSKIVRPAGDRVKTDARDAMLLARLLRMDEISPVRVPSVIEEAARDLARAREDARADLMASRHRLSKLLLRHGHIYSGGNAWTAAHDQWMRKIRFDQLGTRAAFDSGYADVVFTLARRNQLDQQIQAMAADSEFTPVINRLCCLRGIDVLTGFGLAVEIGDWARFDPVSIGAFVGLAPGEASSGERRVVTSITKAGNTHARRLLVEAAWHHKPSYTPGNTMLRRWNKAPGPVVAKAHQANKRLHQRWLDFDARHKRPVIANVAIARELAGWCHTLATME
jgi:transposase